ncbi:MAG: TonB-dependent receptor [Mucilaginibacter sp.]
MKRHLLAIIFLFFSTGLLAQSPALNVTVKGMVVDSATNKTMDFVTIALQDIKTKSAVKSTLTKTDGSFQIATKKGQYNIVLAFMGYANKTIALDSTVSEVNLGSIKFSASAQQLNEVQVTGVKPLMKQEVDRISYDVQADPESKVVTALDMMRKVPMVSVDGQDNIKLRGTGNYKILLNGKESALLAKNPSDVLKAMPGTNIVRIEVITTPPAKYDAEGLAGIINIITQKKGDEGYNGSVSANYNTVWGTRVNASATVKQGKFGFNTDIGWNTRPELSSDFFNQTDFFDPATGAVTSSIVQNGSRFSGRKSKYANAELSFEADSLNLITASLNYYNGDNTQGNSQFSVKDSDDVRTASYNTFNNGKSQYKGTDLGLDYQLGFKRNKDQLLTVSYKYSESDNEQFNNVTSDHGLGYNQPDYKQYNNSGSKEHTGQLDYVQPFKVLTIEAGGKMIIRDSYSDFSTAKLAAGDVFVTDPSQVNNFIYSQDVYSLYNSYQLKFTKYTVKAGLRLERTVIDGAFSEGGIAQRYNNLVPSLSIQRSLKSSSLTFGFTQRIQRPYIDQLNPFVDRSNPQYVNVGNPYLRPTTNNNFELGYSNFTKGSININTNYSFSNNSIESVTSYLGGDTTGTTFANVGQNKNLGLDVNINYPITTKLNVNINAEIRRVWLRGTYNGEFYSAAGQQGHVFTYTSYKFDSGYRVGMNINFDSRYVMLQGTDNYWVGGSLYVSKELLNKKLNISLGVNNPFAKFNKLDFRTRTRDFSTTNYFYNYYRAIGFGLQYKFGRLNANIKKNQRGINNDDKSSGGRN